MAEPRVLVLRAAGINCDEETAYAWQLAGARAERLHVNRLLDDPRKLATFQVITIPGGFSYGDDIASGRILASQLVHHLGEVIRSFVDGGGLVLGICNGFQVLVRLGLLPGADCGVRATLALNDSGWFEDRWVSVRAEVGHCAFIEQGEVCRFPVAHAEGKVVVEGNEAGLSRLECEDHIALRYVAADGGEPEYPENPNGSIGNVAGLTDKTGRVLGLMPHPERNILPTHQPGWTRDSRVENDGIRLFRRAVASLS
ncbi:MAG: phosphoribosylformylglycinamidine synthase I [Phycisphaerae bacterium]|nr:phosphoribosylformylglycinamidine synthase I [Phycisphaerae bacterium]